LVQTAVASESAAGRPLYYEGHAAARRRNGSERPQHNLIR
jgi:hypothetical protein